MRLAVHRIHDERPGDSPACDERQFHRGRMAPIQARTRWSYAWLPPAPVASRGAAPETTRRTTYAGPRRTAANMTETAPVVTAPPAPRRYKRRAHPSLSLPRSVARTSTAAAPALSAFPAAEQTRFDSIRFVSRVESEVQVPHPRISRTIRASLEPNHSARPRYRCRFSPFLVDAPIPFLA